jgi:hypothetical protein
VKSICIIAQGLGFNIKITQSQQHERKRACDYADLALEAKQERL